MTQTKSLLQLAIEKKRIAKQALLPTELQLVTQEEAELLAVSLIAKHLPVGDWSFKWNKRIGALGLCSYRSKTIQLSTAWTAALPRKEVIDTILHEIAHAIAGHKAGHGYEWRQACIAIGAVPETLASNLGVTVGDIAKVTHKMVTPEGVVLKEYLRTPPTSTFAKLKTYYQRGNKANTLGKIKIITVSTTGLHTL